jgi:hypothetical protein
MNRSEFPNLAIISSILKDFCKPFLKELQDHFETSDDKFEGVRNAASDQNNEEILAICDYIERKGLIKTFFSN